MLALQKELQQLYPAMPDLSELKNAQLLLAHGDEGMPPLACVAMQDSAPEALEITGIESRIVEIKRLFVHPSARGRGLAKRLLQALETLALQQHVAIIRLETGYLQHAAMALYQALGYQPIPAFGIYSGQSFSRCFEKKLLTA